MSEYHGHAQTDKFRESFKVSPENMPSRNPPPHILPERLRAKKKRRIKAFRVTEDFAYDMIRGYQLDADAFKICRIRPGLIPLDAKLVWIDFDHTKHCVYACIEHESYPEYQPGTTCDEIPIEVEEIEVRKSAQDDAFRPPNAQDVEQMMRDAVAKSALDEVERLKEESAQLLFRLRQIREEAGAAGDAEQKLCVISTVARCGEIGYIGKGDKPSTLDKVHEFSNKAHEIGFQKLPPLMSSKWEDELRLQLGAIALIERQRARRK